MTHKRTLRRAPAPFGNLSPLQQKLRTHEKNFIESFTGKKFATLTDARKGLSQAVKEQTAQLQIARSGRSTISQAYKIQAVAPPKPQVIPPPKTEPKVSTPPSIAWANTATRTEKFKYAQKVGSNKYHRRIQKWWDDFPDEDPEDNPFCYHGKE